MSADRSRGPSLQVNEQVGAHRAPLQPMSLGIVGRIAPLGAQNTISQLGPPKL